MTSHQIGLLMTALPFIVVFGIFCRIAGFWVAAGVFVGAFLLAWWLSLANHFLNS